MSGISSAQYKAVQSHYAALADCLDSNAAAKKCLERQLKAKGWIGAAGSNSSDELIDLVLVKIKLDKSKFDEFMEILRSVAGLEDIAGMISDLVPNPTSGRSRPVATPASPSAGADILGKKPDLKHIGMITYSHNGEKKKFRPVNKISIAWEAIATQLKVNGAIIQNEKGKDQDATTSANEMIRIWLGSDRKATWAKLIKAMKVKHELKNAAEKMKTALLNMVDSDDEDN